MRKTAVAVVVTCILFATLTAGCSPIEKQAYQAVVSANAFLKSMKAQHPECDNASSVLCSSLSRATSAKDALIDAVEVYCAGPDFNGGGKCNPPAKGTPGADQAQAKLRAAISQYEQIESDLKLAAGAKP